MEVTHPIEYPNGEEVVCAQVLFPNQIRPQNIPPDWKLYSAGYDLTTGQTYQIELISHGPILDHVYVDEPFTFNGEDEVTISE